METPKQPGDMDSPIPLETFLVEWKHYSIQRAMSRRGSLETFLVEWKPAMPTFHLGAVPTLKPS